MRIDAHQHYWRFDPVRDSWITPDMAVLRRDFLPEDVAPKLAAAGIDGVVAVQADQSVAETDFLLSLAARHSFIRGVVGWIDLRATDLSEQLARWRRNPLLKGFRHIAQGEPDDFLARSDIAAGIAELAHHGFSYDILIYPRQLAAAEQLVSRCPKVRFVLDHCAKPPIASGDICGWQQGFRRLARHENVTCKLSGLVTEASWSEWTEADLLPCLDTALEAFGPGRLMFGSDWPVCLLAADYAHEIKNPLTPIQLSAEHMRRKLLAGMNERDAQVLERATHTIVQQVEAMKQMVNAFSEYARAPAMQITRVDLNQLVGEVADLYRAQAGTVAIRTELDRGLGELEADRGRLRQILNNLVVNSIEALEGIEQPRIEIRTEAVGGEGDPGAVLTVSDNGPGIAQELLARIFEPYVTSKPRGTGLGLAIVKRVVEEHGGRIEAENRPEGGARLRVMLPLRHRSRASAARDRVPELRRERA